MRKGLKKLFSLTKTKIRLAEEAGTTELEPSPLPLIKFFSGKEIKKVAEAKNFREELSKKVNFNDREEIAETTFQLLEIIEGVKYKFEPEDCCFSFNEEKLKEFENEKNELVILIMTKRSYPEKGINLFFGENTPNGAIFISKVPSSIAPLLNFAFHSNYFFKEGKLQHITSILGRKTILAKLIHFSLGEFGVTLNEENERSIYSYSQTKKR